MIFELLIGLALDILQVIENSLLSLLQISDEHALYLLLNTLDSLAVSLIKVAFRFLTPPIKAALLTVIPITLVFGAVTTAQLAVRRARKLFGR